MLGEVKPIIIQFLVCVLGKSDVIVMADLDEEDRERSCSHGTTQ